jgi:hypothetical protein
VEQVNLLHEALSAGVLIIMVNQHRTSTRLPMELPVEIRWKSPGGGQKQAMGKTGNISGTGLFIEIPIRLQRATIVRIKVVLPREGDHVPLELLCEGRVVRWNQRGKVQGMAAVIDSYELRPMSRTGTMDKRTAQKN